MFGRDGDEDRLTALEEATFDRTVPGDAVGRDFDNAPANFAPGADGIPQLLGGGMGHIPPLSPDTFVCMADTSLFVVRDASGHVWARLDPKRVSRDPVGRYWTPTCDVAYELNRREQARVTLADQLQRVFDEMVRTQREAADRELRRRLKRIGCEAEVSRGRCEVQPVRPQCQHYHRYFVDLPSNPENQTLERICAAQRDDNGLLLSVANQHVHACELREPRDPKTEQKLEEFDEEKIRLGRERLAQQATFDVDAALADQEETTDD